MRPLAVPVMLALGSVACGVISGLGAYSFEILVVDDSAADVRAAGRAAIQESSLPANVSARLVDGPRSGKGAAVRMGIASTRGEVVFLLDPEQPGEGHAAIGVPLEALGLTERYAGCACPAWTQSPGA